ncbi:MULTISPECIES: DUF6950 family protein [unclassified Brevundimonas]|uniref:DUF6950 family protein n=1 Tax=unclassified Brevundimonas TaxID=2622653 RepID=UPI0025BC9E2C|nr:MULTISPECIES: hypothetical protein [unclassified Brevundimonas]
MAAHVMVRRVAAVEATIKRFEGKPLAYGRDDCARMAAFCLRKLGVKASLLKAGAYRSALGARRALMTLGYSNLEDAVDGLGLPRIAPATALPGDILALQGEDGVALCVAIGNGRALGFWASSGVCTVIQPLEYVAAWRSI